MEFLSKNETALSLFTQSTLYSPQIIFLGKNAATLVKKMINLGKNAATLGKKMINLGKNAATLGKK